jgi:hypothetical protein
MASTKYTYSISNDTVNGKVDTSRLQSEIQASLITIAIEHIDTNGDLLEILMKNDLSSQETSYLDGVVATHSGEPLISDAKVTADNKLYVKNTARPIGTFSCFSSYGDNPDVVNDVGGGAPLNMSHSVGDPLTQYHYCDFNVKENKTYLQEGYVIWDKAVLDRVIMEVVPKVTVYTPGTNTFFNVYGGYLVVPAAGDGYANIHPNDMRLVEVPLNIDDSSRRQGPGYWNAEYDTVTHTFQNITAAPMGDGEYNMFTAEITLERVANLCLLGCNKTMNLRTEDVAELGHGMRIRLTAVTTVPDHEWFLSIILSMHRSHSRQF